MGQEQEREFNRWHDLAKGLRDRLSTLDYMREDVREYERATLLKMVRLSEYWMSCQCTTDEELHGLSLSDLQSKMAILEQALHELLVNADRSMKQYRR